MLQWLDKLSTYCTEQLHDNNKLLSSELYMKWTILDGFLFLVVFQIYIDIASRVINKENVAVWRTSKVSYFNRGYIVDVLYFIVLFVY